MKKPIPFDFVLEELSVLNPRTKPMFGWTAVYVEDKIVFILCGSRDPIADHGVWLATIGEYHESLQAEFPSMRSLEKFGPGPTAWQVLPADADDFESSVMRACELVRQRDFRIGKVPKSRPIRRSKSHSDTAKSKTKKSPLNLGPDRTEKKSSRKTKPAKEPASEGKKHVRSIKKAGHRKIKTGLARGKRKP